MGDRKGVMENFWMLLFLQLRFYFLTKIPEQEFVQEWNKSLNL